jgi:hypothetical protein
MTTLTCSFNGGVLDLSDGRPAPGKVAVVAAILRVDMRSSFALCDCAVVAIETPSGKALEDTVGMAAFASEIRMCAGEVETGGEVIEVFSFSGFFGGFRIGRPWLEQLYPPRR